MLLVGRKDALNILVETTWKIIVTIVIITVIVHAHLLPFNKPLDTTKYPIPTASMIAPKTKPTIPEN